ncbi:hypothetical protein HLB44_34860 [Aquincola sp. S2]|uniref:N-acetyltransferase domain-containing protein n=1 Tax=Pseudaquabacterium terrae TaxID=2732868 RepID=A0ABX2EU41_9BURK|nr:hypothetical protein [Aquabacterium terrae]NRF72178.1 hypothetical protein [Aquabacterium terrae]
MSNDPRNPANRNEQDAAIPLQPLTRPGPTHQSESIRRPRQQTSIRNLSDTSSRNASGSGATQLGGSNFRDQLNAPPFSRTESPPSGSVVKSAVVDAKVDKSWLFEAPRRPEPEPPCPPSSPILVLKGANFVKFTEQFKKDLSELQPSPDQDPAWQLRLRHTHAMANRIDLEAKRGFEGLVFPFDGKPAGLMTVKRNTADRCLDVSTFVTHPLSDGVGVSLSEAAVNRSEALGMGGRLQGEAFSDELKQMYLAMGCEDDVLRMVLDPASRRNRDKWEKIDGQWGMKRYADRSSLHSDFASMNKSDSEKKAGKSKA